MVDDFNWSAHCPKDHGTIVPNLWFWVWFTSNGRECQVVQIFVGDVDNWQIFVVDNSFA